MSNVPTLPDPLPKHWKLSDAQGFLVGVLADRCPDFTPTPVLVDWLYGESWDPSDPVPARLKTLVCETRRAIEKITDKRAFIDNKRNVGYRMRAATVRDLYEHIKEKSDGA